MTDAPYRVLVIEDDEDVALFTRTVLEKRAGCDVRVLYSAIGAIDVVREFRPDVLVTDVELPGRQRTRRPRAGAHHRPVASRHRHDGARLRRLRGAGAARSAPTSSSPSPCRAPCWSTPSTGSGARSAQAAAARRDAHGARDRRAPRRRRDRRRRHARRARRRRRPHRHPHALARCPRRRRRRPPARVAGVGRDRSARGSSSRTSTDTRIPNADPTVGIIERVVAEVSPDIVYTHTKHDRHQDHRAVHEATLVATRKVPTRRLLPEPVVDDRVPARAASSRSTASPTRSSRCCGLLRVAGRHPRLPRTRLRARDRPLLVALRHRPHSRAARDHPRQRRASALRHPSTRSAGAIASSPRRGEEM